MSSDRDRKRSGIEIEMAVLEVINSGETKPTHIFQLANVTWNRSKKAFLFLEQHGLITSKKYRTSRRYAVTEKGKYAVKKWIEFLRFVEYP